MNECATLAADIGQAFQQLFDIGAFYSLALVACGYFMGVLPSLADRYFQWRESRSFEQ